MTPSKTGLKIAMNRKYIYQNHPPHSLMIVTESCRGGFETRPYGGNRGGVCDEADQYVTVTVIVSV